MEVSREVSFHAFHSHRGMLSEPVHDHEFKVRILLEGEPNEEGFICDFRAVKRIFNRVHRAIENVRIRPQPSKNRHNIFIYFPHHLHLWTLLV